VNLIFQKLRRSDIMVAVRKDYAAPTGLEFGLGCGSTKMPRRRRYASDGVNNFLPLLGGEGRGEDGRLI
jgi:hypothetical protein